MVKFGKISDFNLAVKRLRSSFGSKVTVTKSPSDLIRKAFVGKEEAVSIARMGSGWVFRYNSKFWSEKTPTIK